MKRMVSCIAMLCMMASANICMAGDRAGAFSISPFAGGYSFDKDQRRDQDLRTDNFTYGLRLGYDFTDHFGTEVVGSYVQADRHSSDNNVKVFNTHLDFLYNFMPHSMIVPYIAVGGGAIGLQKMHTSDDYDWDGAANAGLGVKFFMTDSVALRLDGRAVFNVGYKVYDNYEYTAGLSFLFGGAKPAAEAMVTQEQPREAPAEAAPAPMQEAPPEVTPATEPTPGHYKYCVTLHTEFDIDRALVRPEYQGEIAKVGDFMKRYPTTTAVIEGHTDNVGNPQYNLDLSQRRAESIVNYLVEHFGIDRSRLTAKGYGDTRPVADNSTDEGKQKNRRIEAIIDCAFDMKEITPPERLCMSLVIEFDTGNSTIKSQYDSEIAKVADYMKKYPTTTAVIEGHTDNVGGYDYNMKLSQERAQAVVNYLVDHFGIERSRLNAKGYGYTRRIAYDNTEEGRQKNRRINAVIDCVVKP